MVAVNVMQRDGPARAHVLLQGKEVEEGWTDAVIPDLPTGLQ
jgi:hypothetical protein